MLVAGAFKPRWSRRAVRRGATFALNPVESADRNQSLSDEQSEIRRSSKRRSATVPWDYDLRGLKAPATGIVSLRDTVKPLRHFS